jgi:hypothetical protein
VGGHCGWVGVVSSSSEFEFKKGRRLRGDQRTRGLDGIEHVWVDGDTGHSRHGRKMQVKGPKSEKRKKETKKKKKQKEQKGKSRLDAHPYDEPNV